MTSLAHLAASSPSAVLMSTSLNSATSQTSTAAVLSSNFDLLNDTNYEIKTEFYTREGVWRLAPGGEYARQVQTQQSQVNYTQTSMQQTNSSVSNSAYTTTPAAGGLNAAGGGVGLGNAPTTNNDSVRIAQFKFSRNMHSDNSGGPVRKNNSRVCVACKLNHNTTDNKKSTRGLQSNYEDDDDDDDVVCTRVRDELAIETTSSEATNTQYACKYCRSAMNADGQLDTAAVNSPALDLLFYNFSREIYFYEFNPVKSTTSSDEPKNLVRKKMYKTFVSTCLDANKAASAANTNVLQAKRINYSSSNLSNSDKNSTNSAFNTAATYLSLVVAAGFAKGEIHVFDLYKNDASVFYNNSKLVDKSKVTCIKWLPNSVNLFLAGYSSGNMYLYDCNDQTQPTTAPNLTKLCQTDSFSIFINSNASLSSNLTVDANLQTTNKDSNTFAPRLVLSNANASQSVPVAKNPLLQLTIGSELNCAYGVNGVNEFAFSPDDNHLAVVSQDGYMRVFKFLYQNNQQMQIQLRCSMKSYFGGLLCVCWSPDGKYIVTGGEDDLITVFAFESMRVACRGRGHSSWINCVTFDPWTTLTDYTNNFYLNLMRKEGTNKSATTFGSNLKHNVIDDNDNSDLEEMHNNSSNTDEDSKQQHIEKKLELLEFECKNKITAPKKRTISTLSDFCNSVGAGGGQGVYYRLASVGQDMQLCFWDLTEDVLKEKPLLSHNRSRLTSMLANNNNPTNNLPQVIINNINNNSDYSVTGGSKETGITSINSTSSRHHHLSAATSIVLTARSLFSSKHSEKSSSKNTVNPSNSDHHSNDEDEKASTKSGVGGFFKRHKRNASLTNQTTSSATSNDQKSPSIKAPKNSQVVLNSYKKSSSEFNGTASSSNMSELGVNSISNRLSNSPNNSAVTFNTSITLSGCRSGNNSSPFNMCPKLDEVAIIEPLICKRIATERLTSLVFKEDCFLVATQDGIVYTWARPSNKEAVNSTAYVMQQPTKLLPQLSNDSGRIISTNL